MVKLFHALLKELKLLQRDLVGFAIIFLMPLVLIITITYIQYSIESKDGAMALPILLVNKDDGNLSKEIIANLQENNNLKIVQEIDGKKLEEINAKQLIQKGEQQILIIIPTAFSEFTESKTNVHVSSLLSQVMPDMETISDTLALLSTKKEIDIFYDPAISQNIRNSLKQGIESMISKMETEAIYSTFEEQFETDLGNLKDMKLITFKEQSVSMKEDNIVPNAVQHNLPAWTLFAIFFIVLPLSINIVKEKNQGTYIRLKTLPVSSFSLILSKIIVYLLVCMVQFYLMLLVSLYFFPLIGLPPLELSGKLFYLSIVALFSGLAAIGFGVFIGTFAKTHEQAAPFGATSVVILAAIGGLWFPIYAMPESMQMIARISPMNWGLESFYIVLLREANSSLLFLYLGLLFLFFLGTMALALLYEQKTKQS